MKYTILGIDAWIDGRSGCFAFSENDLNRNALRSFDFDSFKPLYKEYNPTSVTFCVNLSDSCNLACDYCFNYKKKNKSIVLEDALSFLETCFSTFPKKEKYYVDLSGKGEPLLFIDKILKIKEYCDRKSNELNREILVQFVCNGTLLETTIAEILQKNGILFGVSLDGDKKTHDKHRKTKDGNSTYELILNNVTSISHHEYVGAACTLTSDVFSLKESLVELSKTFNTVSYKPSRDCEFSINEKSIAPWLKSYDDLIEFLVEETSRGNLKYIKTLLNGDDYFGKYLKRVMLNQRSIVRCDAGLSRFTLDDNGFVYACPASFKIEKLKVGDKKHIDLDKSENLFREQIMKDGCCNCDFRNICGGECMVESYISKGINKTMCKYKSHLILLSIYFAKKVMDSNPQAFSDVREFCIEVDNRRRLDKSLALFLEKHPEYDFITGKRVYDAEEKKY